MKLLATAIATGVLAMTSPADAAPTDTAPTNTGDSDPAGDGGEPE